MYFYNRIITIENMTAQNQNLYFAILQTLNTLASYAQSGNKSQWVVVIP